MHTSLAISGGEGYKTGSAGSEGSGKPAYPVFGPAPVKAAPAFMGERATASGLVQNTAEATRQFALEFVRSSGSESGRERTGFWRCDGCSKAKREFESASGAYLHAIGAHS
eukprot:11219178-Heterocapsa_arctica.AAC.1